MSKYGFTLVELSIVLVIIGLLVGAVIAGQELITTSRLNKQISEWEQVKRAYGTYLSKYGKMPGDDNKATTWFGSNTYNGNYDRRLGGTVQRNYYAYNSGFSGETCLFFQHLQMANLLSITSIPDSATSCSQPLATETAIPGVTIPKLIDERRAYLITDEAADATGGVAVGEKLICTLNGASNGTGQFYSSTSNASYRALTAQEANYFDNKLDDGLPMQGRIRATNESGHSVCSPKFHTITGAGASANCGNSTGYNLSYQGLACALTIQLGF